MPLNARGQKLRDKFRGQYGTKKGDSVFYAMENSGKLKGVLKAKGGADASKKDYQTPGSGAYSRSYNPGAGGVVQHGGSPNMGGGNVSGGGTKKSFKNPFINEQGKFNVIGPVTAGLRIVQEIFTPKNKSPLSANTIKQTRKKMPIGGGGNNNRPQLCPDGTLPPCKIDTVKANNPLQANQSNFLKDFQTYNSGGVSYGPPPKRGPNPQVPPVKMKNGKMTNKYKMSCPHRPDGIRGMGAAIKGHKFIGVK